MKRSGLLAASIATLVLFSLRQDVGAAASNSTETYKQLNLFGEVFERVRAEYVDDVSDDSLVESAINGMLTSLDPHSNYLNTKNFNDMKVQTRGEFGGLGIEVSMENGLVKVVSPIDDTPAARAGLKPGDLITHLDGDPVQGMTLPEAVERAGGTLVITADHGNAEMMRDTETGEPHTAHTLNPVPFIVVNPPAAVRHLDDGRLSDVAPTLLDILGLPKPSVMTGHSLIVAAAKQVAVG